MSQHQSNYQRLLDDALKLGMNSGDAEFYAREALIREISVADRDRHSPKPDEPTFREMWREIWNGL